MRTMLFRSLMYDYKLTKRAVPLAYEISNDGRTNSGCFFVSTRPARARWTTATSPAILDMSGQTQTAIARPSFSKGSGFFWATAGFDP
ncbi:hypothetical protein [Pandoravirus japonicus]|uniref:Uncharacterized protein n=1 Tax=Pandoravirus japonicus TaxID=2823154 RepID=A0A811BQ77_9VIRU|nr:hypothetical protein [Pandoravirus japonicus]